MISGRTFAREMIALRQREAKHAGRILALQGQNPGQLELRTHSEFGANLSVTPGGFAFLCLRAIPRRSSPAGYHSLRLRPAKQNHSISFSIQRCQTPGTKDSYTHLTTPSAGRTGGVLTCLIKYPSKLFRYQESPYFPKIYCIRISEPDNAYKKLRHGRNMLKFRTIPQTVISYPKMTPSTP